MIWGNVQIRQDKSKAPNGPIPIISYISQGKKRRKSKSQRKGEKKKRKEEAPDTVHLTLQEVQPCDSADDSISYLHAPPPHLDLPLFLLPDQFCNLEEKIICRENGGKTVPSCATLDPGRAGSLTLQKFVICRALHVFGDLNKGPRFAQIDMGNKLGRLDELNFFKRDLFDVGINNIRYQLLPTSTYLILRNGT